MRARRPRRRSPPRVLRMRRRRSPVPFTVFVAATSACITPKCRPRNRVQALWIRQPSCSDYSRWMIAMDFADGGPARPAGQASYPGSVHAGARLCSTPPPQEPGSGPWGWIRRRRGRGFVNLRRRRGGWEGLRRRDGWGACTAGPAVGDARHNRDRGEPRGSAPPAPPCRRVRMRRLGGVERRDAHSPPGRRAFGAGTRRRAQGLHATAPSALSHPHRAHLR